MPKVAITGDGEFTLIQNGENRQSESAYYMYGSFGGGTLVFDYINEDGVFTPYTQAEATVTAPGELLIKCGLGRGVGVTMTGSTAPTLVIELNPVPTGRG